MASAPPALTGNSIVDGVGAVVQTDADIRSAAGSSSLAGKIEGALTALADVGEEGLGLLGELHVLNTSLVSKGTSIAQLIAAMASAFEGVKL